LAIAVTRVEFLVERLALLAALIVRFLFADFTAAFEHVNFGLGILKIRDFRGGVGVVLVVLLREHFAFERVDTLGGIRESPSSRALEQAVKLAVKQLQVGLIQLTHLRLLTNLLLVIEGVFLLKIWVDRERDHLIVDGAAAMPAKRESGLREGIHLRVVIAADAQVEIWLRLHEQLVRPINL